MELVTRATTSTQRRKEEWQWKSQSCHHFFSFYSLSLPKQGFLLLFGQCHVKCETPPPLQHFLFSLAPGSVDILNFYCPNILCLLFVSAMAVFCPPSFPFLAREKKSLLITQQPRLISQLVVFNIPDSLVLWHFSLGAAGVQRRSRGGVCFWHTHTQTHSLTRLLWGLTLYSDCGWSIFLNVPEVTFIAVH